MILQSISLLFLLNLAKADRGRESCEWIPNYSGNYANCLPGWYAKGICGSGKRGTCKPNGFNPIQKRYDYLLYCCQNSAFSALPDTSTCTTTEGEPGDEIQCPANTIMTGICQSLGSGACPKESSNRKGTSFTIDCCEKSDIIVTDTSDDNPSCGWYYANSQGDNVTCPRGNYVMLGMCGGNSQPECDVKNYHDTVSLYGIFCCAY